MGCLIRDTNYEGNNINNIEIMRNIINTHTNKAYDKMPETILSPTPKASSVWLGHCSSIGGTELLASIVGISDCTIANEILTNKSS